MPLAFGGRLIVVETLLDVVDAPARAEVRLINTGPSMMEALLGVDALPSGLRTVNLCGKPLSRGLADRIFASAPSARLINFYGPTETTVYSTWSEVDFTSSADRRQSAAGCGTRRSTSSTYGAGAAAAGCDR